MDSNSTPATQNRARGIFCNRTINFRSLRAIGYDMDYTLVHYHVDEWERRTFEHVRQHFRAKGWPVDGLTFDPSRVMRGLVIDTELGNLVKADRFGFIKRALHGTVPLDFADQRTVYARTIVELSDPRWVFLNTLFSISEACMYSQLVDLLDQRRLPEVLGYADLYRRVMRSLDAAHMEGQLKAEILANPDRFVVLDPEIPLTLLDQRHAGKKLLLITNSEWNYTAKMMRYAFDRFLPRGMTWRELFDVVIVSARKPEFFTTRSPLFEVATEEGLLRPAGGLRSGTAYFGGSASEVEKHLGVSGDDILYVGDHMFGDVHVTNRVLRWRTALVLRELEAEISAIEAFRTEEQKLARLMGEKHRLEAKICQARLNLQRKRADYGPPLESMEADLEAEVVALRSQLEALDEEIAPIAKASAELSNPTWGLLMRAGNDKSHLARQVERYADIYMSRVSNLMLATPFEYARSHHGSLPHDPSPARGGTNQAEKS